MTRNNIENSFHYILLKLKTFKMASRFHQTNSNELEALKSKTRNKNTDHSTGTWINTFQSWAKERVKLVRTTRLE